MNLENICDNDSSVNSFFFRVETISIKDPCSSIDYSKVVFCLELKTEVSNLYSSNIHVSLNIYNHAEGREENLTLNLKS